jgi:hypothetical protein
LIVTDSREETMVGFRSVGSAAAHQPDIYIRGPVDMATIAYAQKQVARAARTDLPVQHLKIKIAHYGEKRQPPLCVAQVSLDVAGRLVRRQAAAASPLQAVDRITTSLPPGLHRLQRHLTRPVGPPSFTDEEWQQHRGPGWPPPREGPPRTARRPRRSRPTTTRSCPSRCRRPSAVSTPAAPFLIFADAATARGEVLYRRYDGHLGLLTAVW